LIAAGISSASTLVERVTVSFAEASQIDDDGEVAEPAIHPTIFGSLYDSIQVEASTAEPTVEGLIDAIPAQVTRLARDIVALWDEIAVLSETSTGEPLFTPTRKAVTVSGQLGLVVVSSREQFEVLAEGLYFYLYEASADWKRVRKYIPDFPKVADRIKHFRLYKAHDTQHGKSAEIVRKARQVGDHLLDLTGKRVPATLEDWQRAQIQLLTEVADFLRTLRDAILQSSPEA
jgi:hypothetical protein